MLSKRLFISICGILLLITHSILHAQEKEEELNKIEKKDVLMVDAELWLSNGDTLIGKIIYLNQYNYQFSVTHSDTNGNAITYYAPRDLIGFRYTIDKDSIDFISMDNPTDMGRLFLRILNSGKIKIFQFLTINNNSSTYSFNTSYFIWKEEWLYPPITMLNASEALLRHFSDCPELEYKIKTGEYGFFNIGAIIKEYDHCELTDDYEFFYE